MIFRRPRQAERIVRHIERLVHSNFYRMGENPIKAKTAERRMQGGGERFHEMRMENARSQAAQAEEMARKAERMAKSKRQHDDRRDRASKRHRLQ
jgi:hypothetical protein